MPRAFALVSATRAATRGSPASAPSSLSLAKRPEISAHTSLACSWPSPFVGHVPKKRTLPRYFFCISPTRLPLDLRVRATGASAWPPPLLESALAAACHGGGVTGVCGEMARCSAGLRAGELAAARFVGQGRRGHRLSNALPAMHLAHALGQRYHPRVVCPSSLRLHLRQASAELCPRLLRRLEALARRGPRAQG